MDHFRRVLTLLSLAASLATTACGVDTEAEFADDPDPRDETGVAAEAITGPSSGVGYTPGLVRIDFPSTYCTGFLIGPNMVMTAAHCVADATDSGTYEGTFNGVRWGHADARIVYKPSASETMCLHDHCFEEDGDIAFVDFLVWWHAGFDWEGSDDDIAIITRGTGASFVTKSRSPGDAAPRALNSGDYFRIFAANSTAEEEMLIAGYGATDDNTWTSTPHFGLLLMDSWHTEYLRADFENTAFWGDSTCGGDSGGPLFYPRAIEGRNYVVGIASRSPGRVGACPEEGDDLYFTRIAPKIGMVDVVQNWAGNPDCASYSTTSLMGNGNYYRCW